MNRYPKPGDTGGWLIREVISFLKGQQVSLPITSHILIAVSGGSDSVALAHLLVHYGRRVGLRNRIRLLHINHGWRGVESDADAQFVRELGKAWKIPVTIKKLRKTQVKARSLEEVAREERKRIYTEMAGKYSAVVLTAHQADDLAETLLWRIFTGANETHGAGIYVAHERELRPFLRVRKRDLKEYLEEERQTWHEDRTNSEGRFLRSRMRMLLMPAIESLFPRAVEHLVKMALEVQAAEKGETAQSSEEPGEVLLAAERFIGQPLRRAHWDVIKRTLGQDPAWNGEIHLPGAWRLKREKGRNCSEGRWILEKL